MNNIEQIIGTLILGMRDGKEPIDILEDNKLKELINDMKMPIMSKSDAAQLANYVVYDLYDGKFPVDHLSPGDICIDAFHCNPCIITNINERSIHVLYFNGKTHKFKISQERYFKKLGSNLFPCLQSFLELAQKKYNNEMKGE